MIFSQQLFTFLTFLFTNYDIDSSDFKSIFIYELWMRKLSLKWINKLLRSHIYFGHGLEDNLILQRNYYILRGHYPLFCSRYPELCKNCRFFCCRFSNYPKKILPFLYFSFLSEKLKRKKVLFQSLTGIIKSKEIKINSFPLSIEIFSVGNFFFKKISSKF